MMDVITGLPKTFRKNDAIMVIVDKLSKATHLIPIEATHRAQYIAKIFMKEVFGLHGLPKVIISDEDPIFNSNFRKSLFQELGTQLSFSMACHP